MQPLQSFNSEGVLFIQKNRSCNILNVFGLKKNDDID